GGAGVGRARAAAVVLAARADMGRGGPAPRLVAREDEAPPGPWTRGAPQQTDPARPLPRRDARCTAAAGRHEGRNPAAWTGGSDNSRRPGLLCGRGNDAGIRPRTRAGTADARRPPEAGSPG